MATENKEVYSLMIPTVKGNILLPNSSVAEIVPFSNVELFEEQADAPEMPQWFLGYLLWRGQNIPLISIDVIRGEPDPQANKRSRVAVAHTLNANRELPYIAIVVQGIPRLSHVTPQNIKYLQEEELSDAEKMRVTVDNIGASIPDLDKLEELIVAVQSAA
ncbi:chemotaxis protein CheW [Aliikangiella coralliicola]|uniref:Chemotaxis protein CheW n=1 Tax=Aliikangiella coralliicola TaxID=2592383 RepID=A0A545UHS8_9GAMM|nr:chemotaxis protein CheW [Aliikangiella coralliicola]TQV89027.1 chemotaxis protein CheW [Aliikangiella coralliicola]